ncbi:MAG: hypothetical protein ACREKI_00420, partial [Gemmatimonadota bacterium]
MAESIDLARAEALFAGEAARVRPMREVPRFLALAEMPLVVPLGTREMTFDDGQTLSFAAKIQLYTLGVASLRYEMELPPAADGPSLAGLVRRVAERGLPEDAVRREVDQALARIAPALDQAHTWDDFETYTVLFIERFREAADLASLAESREVAQILLGEPDADLAAETVRDSTKQHFRYSANDLCVIDWDTALVVEPTGGLEVVAVVELALMQLLEFRYYDALFERELLRVYPLIEEPRRRLWWLFRGRYADLTRRVQHLVVESAEFVERAENAVKVIGDFYLARVYRAALERFRVPEWEASVVRRVVARPSGGLRRDRSRGRRDGQRDAVPS